MSNNLNLLTEAYEEASKLANQLLADIPLAATRAEHVRLTARANEAARVAFLLKNYFDSPSGAASP